MTARLFPQRRFLFDGFVVNLLVVRKFDGDFRRYEFSAAFRQPNFAEAAASEFADERVKSDL
jgi:hypothetical protein